jgi:transmembrane protein TMEM174 (potassium channel)
VPVTTLRKHAMDRGVGREPDFRWRGHEVSRIEALSDAVFGFAITLLVVSLEVPRTFGELLATMRGFPAFGVCFTLLLYIWHAHYLFFRRYGLEDGYTVALNGALLFLVLFYVYPLKFLFGMLLDQLLGFRVEAPPSLREGRTLMVVYSLGYFAVFLVFVLLHLHAYRRRADLELDDVEVFDTVSSLQAHGISVAVALLSVALAGFSRIPFAGFIYFLLGPAYTFHGMARGKRRRALVEARASAVV